MILLCKIKYERNVFMGKPKRIPTQEEYEKDKQIILNAYKAGLPVRRMLAKFDYTKTYITNMRATLIEEGLITEEEIKSAFAQYLKENPASQGLDKSRIRKNNGTEKAEKRHTKSLQDREKVLELVKQKYTKVQIAKILEATPTKVTYHINALIEEGRLQSDDIENGNNQSNANIIDKNAPEYLEQREQIVQCLKKGWKNFYIRKELNITPYDFDIYLKDIKRKKIMTTKEINEARERKYQEDLEFVADSINNGLTTVKIRELKPEFTANEVTPMIKELIATGIIS